ncbi:HIT family protein [Acinetobacter larvae]|uniref:Diadenosine tetraphosphate hydrolase n=1 Tax=Acinetobacter larvae TaxID=1789224 RepID=A0A1B2M1C6_9GAMM|nr:HIT family protein [Acinetobacter larvae]AOA59000.1 diadenosine tetraphosphate hydrolase [Acinetobacter larvae]
MSSCIFCEIAEKIRPSHVIAENEKFIAFLSIFPNTLGTTVVIPKRHYPSYIFDLDETIMIELMLFSKQVALKLDHYFDDVGRTALVFEGFGVNHIHAKLFPMHGTVKQQQDWQAINSSIHHYFEKYPGYISTHDADEADAAELAQLAADIRQTVFEA